MRKPKEKLVKRSVVTFAAVVVALGLAYCSFGPDQYVGPWPPDPEPEDDGGNTTEDAPPGDPGDGGSTDR